MAEFKSQDEKTKQAFSMIEQGVKDVYSSESFKQYLSCLSKFHSYSLNNTLLILSQKPEASLVAGYRAWQTNFNRHVNKGEKGLMILAPVTTKEDRLMNKHDENGNVILDESGNPVQEMRVVNLTHFKTTTVFDISQTSGDPLPSLVHDLTGSSNEVKVIIQTIQSVCTIPIEFKTETEDLSFMTGAKGYYSPKKDKIVINKDLEDLQTAKTLIHEYAHSLLHKETDKNQSQREIEAESLAFVICDHFGIDTSEYSFGYIASYANKDYSELKSILVNIQSKAHEMIELIEPVFKENLHMLEKENQYITPVEMEELNHDIVLKVTSMMEKYKAVMSDSNITTSDIHETIDQEISNLLTIHNENQELLGADDLIQGLAESCSALMLCHIRALYYVNVSPLVLHDVDVLKCYDYFEWLTEQLFNKMDMIFFRVVMLEESLMISVHIVSGYDLDRLLSGRPGTEVQREDEKEWLIRWRIS